MSAQPSHPADDSQFTDDLRRAADGDVEARNRLWNDHYEMLHQCAKAWVTQNWRRRGDEYAVSLGGTDIVHAAFERLRDRTAAMENGRAYFFRAFYTECLRIVVDHYRKTKNDRGRGKLKRVELDAEILKDNKVHADFEVLYGILTELEQQDRRVGQVAMLKVFVNRPVEDKAGATRGLTNAEVAEEMGIGLRTVEKDWAFAKAYLLKRLGEEGESRERA